jgi:hypothetical protein
VDFVVVVAPVVAVPPVLANRVVDLGFVIGLLGLPFWPGAVRVVAVGSKK